VATTATVFHELIPGHHLQGFMAARYKPYRSLFGTPFWTEGNALYWEMLFWDLNFPKTPENRCMRQNSMPIRTRSLI
jgi:uncharacterized protein (DUF885 family)